MADRVSASITIGGSIDAARYLELAELISADGLATEWDGEAFEAHHRSVGRPLSLFAHEVAGGRLDTLEDWCLANRLPFVRWCGGFSGQWGPERVVATGDGRVTSYAVTEDDEVVISRSTIEQLGSTDAILAHFDAAEFDVPPLDIIQLVGAGEGGHHVE